MKPLVFFPLLALCLILSARGEPNPAGTPPGWRTESPRVEIRPRFEFDPAGGPGGKGGWIIAGDGREGLAGCWSKTVVVEGGRYYRFSVRRKVTGVAYPRRAVLARVAWRNSRGDDIPSLAPESFSYAPTDRGLIEVDPAYPADRETDGNGWTEVAGVFQAPAGAGLAVLELHYQWAPRGRVEWSEPTLAAVPEPVARTVRLATIHYRPTAGRTLAEKREQFAPLIAEAARQQADLIVLPETLTQYGNGSDYVDSAEAVPGPSTEYFGRLAKQANAYIVAGLVERDGHLIYNVAALLGPDGRYVGKYRKATLPRDEVAAGVTPGHDYPVFFTRFGRLGMMICYDGFFPEVARQLADQGAEVIAWPVAGCNPLLAAARACENHVYLVSSTYAEAGRNWMVSAVFDQEGRVMTQAKNWGTVAVVTIDLNRRFDRFNLGDFRGEVPHERPVWNEAPAPLN